MHAAQFRNNWKKKVLQQKKFDETVGKVQFGFGALSQGFCSDWLVCIAYCTFRHLIGPTVLFFLNWIVCLFVNESPL